MSSNCPVYSSRLGKLVAAGGYALTDGPLYTARLSTYPDGTFRLVVADRPTFHPPWLDRRAVEDRFAERMEAWRGAEWFEGPFDGRMHWIDRAGLVDGKRPPEPRADPTEENLDRARRRARSKLRELLRCNELPWFVTLTLSAERIDRYSYPVVYKRLRVWLSNMVQRSDLRYILIPEYHKDGAIHLHGFFSRTPKVSDSGTVILSGGGPPRKPRSVRQREAWLEAGGKPVYNLDEWGFGWSTAVDVSGGDYQRTAGYVQKYISKGNKKIGGRWYLSGGKLERPAVKYLDLTWEDIADLDPFRFSPEGSGRYFWIIESERNVFHNEIFSRQGSGLREGDSGGIIDKQNDCSEKGAG